MVPDLHNVISNRKTRNRCIDIIFTNIFKKLKNMIDEWTSIGHHGGTVVIDGIDARGGGRAFGEQRQPTIVSTTLEVGTILKRNVSIGEGDLKLACVGSMIRECSAENSASNNIFSNNKLTLVSTVDTDSLAIELLAECKRHYQAGKSP